MAALLACDWGTTHLRAWTLDGEGAVVAGQTFPLGVSRLEKGEAARRFTAEVRLALDAEGLPAVLCGMIGSSLGWATAPYVPCPADLASLAGRLLAVEPRTRIVPGLIGPGLTDASDVMRGEETQVLGWVSQAPERSRGRYLICHPGTHAKWVLLEDGAIVRFVTVMTGELFAVLSRHSVLKGEDPVTDEAAFDVGARAAGDGDALAARLFSARARVVGDGAPPSTTSAYLSGLLIGAETAALRGRLAGAATPIALLGDPVLCGWYARALIAQDAEVSVHDGEAAAIAGLLALARQGDLA